MDTKTKLLNHAEQLARQRGFDGFSYADMAEKIGIKKPSIHYHFPAKSDLALALITRYSGNLSNLINSLDNSGGNAAAKLKAYINIYREALSNGDTICLCIAFSVAKESLSDDAIAQLNLFRNESINWLQKIFKDGKNDTSIAHVVDIKAEASACLATLEGAHLIARAEHDVAIFDNAISLILARLSP